MRNTKKAIANFLRGFGSVVQIWPAKRTSPPLTARTASDASALAVDYAKICGDGQRVFAGWLATAPASGAAHG